MPKYIFLDTSVFAGQQYNFESVALTSFIEVAKDKGLKLLLPAPTSSEVERQIKSRSDEAMKALEDARRRAPFLKKLKYWSEKSEFQSPEWEVRRIAIQEWKGFLSKLNTVPLGYEGIKLEKMMNWYDTIRAPFREGKKRKEFPDAFAIESLALFAAKEQTSIAVVSEDQDFKHACEYFGSLLYFPSLPRLIEIFISQKTSFEFCHNLIKQNIEELDKAVSDQVDSLSFYSDDSEIELRESEIETVTLSDTQIVAIGDSDCIVVFNATMDVKHTFDYLILEGEHADQPHWESDYFRQQAEISGTVKVQIHKAEMPPLTTSFIELDQEEIRVSAPYHNWYRRY